MVPFDYLLLGLGTRYPSEIKSDTATLAQRKRHMHAEKAAIDAAERVLIVGGGAVGCELAGEIREGWPNKPVTLLQSAPTCLPRGGAAAGEQFAEWCRKTSVAVDNTTSCWVDGVTPCQPIRLLCNERLEGYDPRTDEHITDKGTRFDARTTKVFHCTGYRPNTAAMAPRLGGSLDALGFVRTDRSLRVRRAADSAEGALVLRGGAEALLEELVPLESRAAEVGSELARREKSVSTEHLA